MLVAAGCVHKDRSGKPSCKLLASPSPAGLFRSERAVSDEPLLPSTGEPPRCAVSSGWEFAFEMEACRCAGLTCSFSERVAGISGMKSAALAALRVDAEDGLRALAA